VRSIYNRLYSRIIFKCTITVVWVLVILETLGSQCSSQIFEETLDILCFMLVYCHIWNGSRGHPQIGTPVFYGKVFVQRCFGSQSPRSYINTPGLGFIHAVAPCCVSWLLDLRADSRTSNGFINPTL